METREDESRFWLQKHFDDCYQTIGVEDYDTEGEKVVRGLGGGCPGSCCSGFGEADENVDKCQRGVQSFNLLWFFKPVYLKLVFKALVILTLIKMSTAMTVHSVIKPKDSRMCLKNTGQCQLPGSFKEGRIRLYCYSCVAGMPYCIDEKSTTTMYFICATEDEMMCAAGYYGRFTYMEQQNQVQFEKLTCPTGTHAHNMRDCRRYCEKDPKINEYNFTILRAAMSDGTPALLTCNKQNNLCTINPEYGEVFNYSVQVEYDDVCGVPNKDKGCVNAKPKEARKVESIRPEDGIATSPAPVTPDTTLAPDTIQTADNNSVQGNRSIETTNTTENTPLLGQDPTNLGTTVRKNKDGANGNANEPGFIFMYIALSVLLLCGVVGIIRKTVWKKYCGNDEDQQFEQLEQSPEKEDKSDKGTIITNVTVESGAQYVKVKHIGEVTINKYPTEGDDTDDGVEPETERSSLLNGDCLGQTSPVDENSTLSYTSTTTSTNSDV